MKIAIVCSNYLNIAENTKKGTEIFVYTFINSLYKYKQDRNLELTAFASGASTLPVRIESIAHEPSISDDEIISNGKHIIFELALISKAFSMQEEFDLFHINIGDGDIILPFIPFVKKPILITLHHIIDAEFTRKYFSLFKNCPNIFFVSASHAQRKLLPEINYVANIYHGIDVENEYAHDQYGGDNIIWAGRAIPQKGMDIVIEVAKQVKRKTCLFGISKHEYLNWLEEQVLEKLDKNKQNANISLELDRERLSLVQHYQASKLFLYPVQMEESFGLVLIESMACGTPVVAYARGSIPEIIRDGETGFLVNPSDDDIRGNWIINKTGRAGLCEGVDRIFSMTNQNYYEMRHACREQVEKHFTVQRMVAEYESLYYKIIAQQRGC